MGQQEFMKFNKENCKVLQLGRNNPRHQDVLGPAQLESRLAGKALGVLVHTRLTASQQPLLRPPLQCWVQCWAPQYKRDRDRLERVRQRAVKEMKGLEHLCYEERLRAGTVQPGAEQAQADLIRVCKYLEGGCGEDGARLFSVVPRDRTSGHGHKLEHGGVPLNIRKHFSTVSSSFRLIQKDGYFLNLVPSCPKQTLLKLNA
ncbi:hypothetical protein QYF61_015036 [Mycteria americana]|uniref:Uncharacterized protein n=1 Tax=Mycteria americana TaxID=33587 RepID=A0AAN7RQ92_MYCAM|nr:hypothetical protein QYF61_015036 [Mycteria americana]